MSIIVQVPNCIILSLFYPSLFLTYFCPQSLLPPSLPAFLIHSDFMCHWEAMAPGGLTRRDTLPRWGPFSPCAPVWLCASPTATWNCNREVDSVVSSKAMSRIHYYCILLAAFGTSCNSLHCRPERWGCRENETGERGERCLAVLFLGCASRPEGGYSWTQMGSVDFHWIAHSLARKRTTDFLPQRNYFLPYNPSSGLWQQPFPSSEPGLNFRLVCEASKASLLTHLHTATHALLGFSLPSLTHLLPTPAPAAVSLTTSSHMERKVAFSCLCPTKSSESSRTISAIS